MSAQVSPTGALRPGDVVSARYRVERFLDRHLHEESYAVRSLEDGRPLLLKLIVWPGGTPELPPSVHGEWRQLAARLTGFRHPAVSQTLELIPLDGDGHTCLIREPVELEGQTLHELLRDLGRPLSETEVLGLAAQLGEALDAAHRLELLHLCLSPHRIVVLTDGDTWRLKLTDLGLYPPPLAARFAEPGYLAPEVLSGQPCDPRSDQFSLAVVLYELLSGQAAFVGGPDESREVVVQRVVAEDPLPLLLSQKVELALQRALSRSRGVRFPTMRDFVAALGGDVRRFAPLTAGRTSAVKPRRDPGWPRLWLPMVQGALWALCGLALLLGLRKLLFAPKLRPKVTITSHRVQPLIENAGLLDGGSEEPVAVNPPGPSPADKPQPPHTIPGTSGSANGTLRFPPLRGPGGAAVTRFPNKAAANRRDAGSDEPDDPPLLPANEPSSDPPATILVELSSQDGKLSAAQEGKLRACLRLVRRPAPPYRVVLENITGTLYVSPRGTSDEFLTSSDFRDCLKLQISGMIVPKVVTISGKVKGKTTP